jgi:hypothetical protein
MKSKIQDLTQLLTSWEYDESKPIRRLKAEDGREIIQVRLPLGLEQYEIDGRPDGKRPMNHESWLHYYWQQSKLKREDSGEFSLSEEDFARVQQEGLLYYYRYLLFFQVHEYRLCARDTRRNLKLLDFVSKYAPPEQTELLEQYRPYILRMNVMARALFKIQEDEDVPAALRLLQNGIKAVESLHPIDGNQIFEFEKSRSLKSLEDLISQLEAHVPKRVALQNELDRAIKDENYEKAAMLRDEIAGLRKQVKKE